MSLEDAFDEPGFYILGGIGTLMVILGFIASKKMTDYSLPIWQLIVLILGILIASAVFSTKE